MAIFPLMRAKIGGAFDAMAAEGDVTVVVPHRNHVHFLRALLDQLAVQTLQPERIIVVDDASDPKSRQALGELCGQYETVAVHYLEKWSGPNVAICAGLDRALTTYVTLIAADDWIAPTFLERSVAALETFSAAAFCFSDPATARDMPDEARRYSLFLSRSPAYFAPETFVKLLRRANFTFSTNTIVYRRELLARIGGFDPALEWSADWFAAHALALVHGACYLPENLTTLRLRDDSYSSEAMRRRDGRAEVFARVLSTLRDSAPEAATRLRRAAVLPEYDFRYLPVLVGTPEGRVFLSGRVVARIALRQLWAAARPWVPHRLRRGLRRIATRVN